MGLDLNNDYSTAKGKINAYKTVSDQKNNKLLQERERTGQSDEKKKSDMVKQLNELKEPGTGKSNEIKNEIKNQLEQLLDLFKISIPKTGIGGNTSSLLVNVFTQAAANSKEKLKEEIVNQIIDTIGCSEEQSYSNIVNTPFYIKVSQVDLFKKLLISPEDKKGKYFYENNNTTNGSFPYSGNRQLYERLQSNQSFEQEYGQGYVGASGNQLYDIEYVQNFIDPINGPTFGDYFKVTLKNQPNNKTSVSDFLRDYYSSINIFELNTLSPQIMNTLTGSFDILNLTSDEMREESKFDKILNRIMGICTDPTKKIDVAGTAKLSDLDLIDDSFFEITPQELRSIENEINNKINGVVEFEDCGNLKLPVNTEGVFNILDEIISENKDSKKVSLISESIDKLVNDPSWKNLLPKFGLELNLKDALENKFLLTLPKAVFKTILSPKVMLGFLVMVKAISNEFSEQLDDLFDNLTEFMKTFKKFAVNFMKKIFSIFVEELFSIVKKNIKNIVESILLDIIKEAKNKQVSMYATIVYVLFVVGQSVVDFQNCKSVIDEILKLLNLGVSKLNLGLPQFALAGSQFLGGVSDTRSFSNTIENLQKAGLPTGDAPDGRPNLMNMAMMSMIQGQNKENAENGKTEVFIPPLQVIGPSGGVTRPVKGYGKSY